MLSSTNVRHINDAIAKEMREATSWSNDHDEKMAALDRVAKLKSLLSEQPTLTCDADQIANLVIEKLTKSAAPAHTTLASLIDAFTKR